MDEAVDLQDNSRPLNIFGGNFTDVKGDVHHYHIRGNLLNHEPELGRGEFFFFQRLTGDSDGLVA